MLCSCATVDDRGPPHRPDSRAQHRDPGTFAETSLKELWPGKEMPDPEDASFDSDQKQTASADQHGSRSSKGFLCILHDGPCTDARRERTARLTRVASHNPQRCLTTTIFQS